MQEHYTIDEAAAYLRLSKSTIERWIYGEKSLEALDIRSRNKDGSKKKRGNRRITHEALMARVRQDNPKIEIRTRRPHSRTVQESGKLRKINLKGRK